MSTITLTGNTLCRILSIGSFTNIGTALSKAKQTTSNLENELNSLKNKIDVVCTAVNVDTSKQQASNAKKREGTKKSSLSLAYDRLDKLISNVGILDNKVATKIEQLKNNFYSKYSYLKPEYEKVTWEKIKDCSKNLWNGICDLSSAIADFVGDVVDWLGENWQALLSVIAAVVAVVVIVIVCVATFGAAAVAIAALVGAVVGVVSQLIGDVISWSVTGEWTGTWQAYLGAALGGVVGGALMLTGNIMLACAVDAGISTFFSESLESITGGEKRSTLRILADTALSVGLAALFSKGFDKLTRIAGKKLSTKIPALSRLSGKNNYDASFKAVLTKLKNGTARKFTIKTFRNGVFSGLWGSAFENIFQGFLNATNIVKSIVDKIPALQN